MNNFLSEPKRHVLFSSAGRNWNSLEADLVQIPAGQAQAQSGELHVLGMHFGPPVNADCLVGGSRRRGVQKPGDIDFIPAGVDGVWEDDATCQVLRLTLRPTLIDQVAQGLGRNADEIDLVPRLQLRDTRIEAIGWAIKADLEADTPSDPLYIDLLANALAVRLIEIATLGEARTHAEIGPKMSTRQLRILIEFIETNLDQKLHLADLASVAGVSSTRLKSLFRNSTGTPVHQYVIRRRVEYARALIATTTMPASQIALAAGFAHQSHMATTMRRLLGQTPGEIGRPTA
ncbi:AraC family transcriptional regulator [Rhizobium changzhiense]|uniref:helix-turn-helix transcriptional regulator n=1 Tax=Rhizobium changzhiense TaxID=2692317 RepID=UPI001F0C9050|nr:AraC family transcriptional regulator [Rhizobium changzhiense]MCH4547426.1 AraC family transcriptional regulator [Rhizobium changzhiense]